MLISKVNTWALSGISATEVEVESDLSKGLPVFQVVGLPEASVRESRDRVRAAIKNSGFQFPLGRVTINLAPADIKKEGTGFDLPIALGILVNSGVVPEESLKNILVLGELSLDGKIKKQSGILPGALLCRNGNYRGMIVPKNNHFEASMIEDINIISAESLSELVMILNGEKGVEYDEILIESESDLSYGVDFSEVKGHEHAKRALTIAAAGGHNILMSGPPGSGKTMLARRVPTILPDMEYEEMLDVSLVYSTAGTMPNSAMMKKRPFRSPHHTISYAGLVGGGRSPKPGEVSLAHRGVLFLDELTEFRRDIIEMLRQPLEDGSICVARAGGSVSFPAEFIMIGAMNPCPCGYLTSRYHSCRCSQTQISRYRNKLSGPILDRIDINLEISDISFENYTDSEESISSPEMKDMVMKARSVQQKRYGSSTFLNSSMGRSEISKFCIMASDVEETMKKAFESFKFSARTMDRILKVARTIADMEDHKEITRSDLMEALQYRVRLGDV